MSILYNNTELNLYSIIVIFYGYYSMVLSKPFGPTGLWYYVISLHMVIVYWLIHIIIIIIKYYQTPIYYYRYPDLKNSHLRVCFWSNTDGTTTGVREIRIHCMSKSNCYKKRLVVLFILRVCFSSSSYAQRATSN